MKRSARNILLAACMICMSINTGFTEEYTLKPGDIVSIGVYGYEELQVKQLVIRPDGKLAFPLIGEVQASGISPAKLTEALTNSLREYIKTPNVTVNIEKYHTTRVYVLGEITKPGLYELEKQHNLLDAIGAAGSYTRETAKKNVFVIHKDQTDKPKKINLLNLLEKGDMSQNITLADGDVVYLTRNHKVMFSRDVLPYISAVYQMSRLDE